MIDIIQKKIEPQRLQQLCDEYFKTFVKIVVDIEQEMIAIGGELHADAEALLVEHGSQQSNLWGANFYPHYPPEQRLEYTALINIRPRDDNPAMEIQSAGIRKKVKSLTDRLILADHETLS